MIRAMFLDFDRTGFNTDAMKLELADRLPALVAGTDTLRDGELRRFVYEDAWQFFKTATVPLILISSVKPSTKVPTSLAFQRAKVAASGITPYFDEILFTRGLKGPLLMRRYPPHEQRDTLIVDDMDDQLLSVQAECPNIRRFKIDRRRTGGDAKNTIASLIELLPFLPSRE